MKDYPTFEEALQHIENIRVCFGLRSKGHLPTIEKMLKENKSWEEIGKEIGWCPKTAEKFYEMESNALSR